MITIKKILGYPLTRLILLGVLKALVIVPIASLLLASFITVQMYGPTFDLNFHIFGTAREFFPVLFVFTTIYSIPVSLIVVILLALYMQNEIVKNRTSNIKPFVMGFLVGGICGGLGSLMTVGWIGVNMIIAVFAGLAGGLGGLWMTKDAIRSFSKNIN